MIDLVATAFPVDEQLTSEFFASHDVRLSVDLVDLYRQSPVVDTRSTYPNFFYWIKDESLFLVDFLDGFSLTLADALGTALMLVASSDVSLEGLFVHWRDEVKAWHTLTPEEVSTYRVTLQVEPAPVNRYLGKKARAA